VNADMAEVRKPPDGYRLKKLAKGFAWCPNCGAERPFGWDARVGYARCMECGTTEREFYVRTFNGLWKQGDLDAFVRAVEASGRRYERPFCWEKGPEAKAEAKVAGGIARCLWCGEAFFTPKPVGGGRESIYCGCRDWKAAAKPAP